MDINHQEQEEDFPRCPRCWFQTRPFDMVFVYDADSEEEILVCEECIDADY